MVNKELKSKKVIVTGCSRGIGKAIAEQLKKESYYIIGLDIEECSKSNIVDEFYKLDLSSLDDLNGFCSSIKSYEIYGIVNNAAKQVESNLFETSVSDWDSVYNTNVRAPFVLMKNLHDQLEQHGTIVNITSVHSHATSAGIGAYASSKGALAVLTKTMAIELGRSKRIRVNSISPGAVDTQMLRKGLSRSGNEDLALKKLESTSPLDKIGKGEDIANLVTFLLDREKSSNITGTDISCDSGILSLLASE